MQELADNKHSYKARGKDMQSQEAIKTKEGEVMETNRYRDDTEAANVCSWCKGER